MGRPRGKAWDKERDALLVSMVREGMSARSIAKVLDLSHPQVIRRANVLGLGQMPEKDGPPKSGAHLQPYKRARRGFHVPAHLEPQYYELLKTGVPIAEACQRLGIAK